MASADGMEWLVVSRFFDRESELERLANIWLLKEKFAAFTKATGRWKRANPQFFALGMEDM